MKLSRRTNTIILWVIAVALLLGMIIMFTPTMGNLFSGQQDTSTPALFVNGEEITQLEIARAQQGALYSRVREGTAGQDLELLMLDQLVQQEVLAQAASRIRVSGGEVRDAVRQFREQNGVAGARNDNAYLNLIGRAGFTDETFRAYIREQLRLEKYQEQLTEDVEVTDEEVQAFYEANRDDYRTEERIEARAIVVTDPDLAQDLRSQAAAGAEFAELAREHSVERADRAGALGAPSGSEDPHPVGRAALPSDVAAAAFRLQGPGLTEVVPSGSRYYIVNVEAYHPADVRPLDEVRDQVESDALSAKRAAVIEDEIERLLEQAEVRPAEESEYAYDNPVVARVGDREVRAVELIRATYTNPQIQQALSPQTADLIAEFFKPTILEQLIDRKLAVIGAEDLEASFIGPEALVAQQALAWVSRDVTASEEELREYYEANTARYTLPAEATVTRVEFADADGADAFRSAVLAGAEVDAAAGEFGGRVEDLGTVRAGELEQDLDTALFGTDGFETLPDSDREVSDVLVLSEPAPAVEGAAGADAEGDAGTDESVDAEEPADGAQPAEADEPADDAAQGEGGQPENGEAADDAAGDGALEDEPSAAADVETYVVLVASRTPERVRPFEDVRAQVEQRVLAEKRAAVQEEWLASLRERVEVVNLLEQVQPAASGAADDAESAAGNGAGADGAGADDAGDQGAAGEGVGDGVTLEGLPEEAADAAEDLGIEPAEEGQDANP